MNSLSESSETNQVQMVPLKTIFVALDAIARSILRPKKETDCDLERLNSLQSAILNAQAFIDLRYELSHIRVTFFHMPYSVSM